MNIENQEKILILGGSRFIGINLLEKLNSSPYKTIYVNRGKSHWESYVKKFSNLEYTFGNRNDYKDYSDLLNYLSFKHGINENNKWLCVIDFCAFSPKNVYSVYKGLKNLMKLYVFISTDSIYDVCDKSARKEEFIVESNAIRSKDPKVNKMLKKHEKYGHKKLRCEELLLSIQNTSGKDEFPFISLRLADVVGPRDNTGRFWAYIKWIELFDKIPFELDEEARNKKISLTYSEDVANLIFKIIKQLSSNSFPKEAFNSFYNICIDEQITVEELLNLVLKIMGKEKGFAKLERAVSFYPSVECGPISNQLAKEKINFVPSKLEEVLKHTIDFFVNAKGYYKKEEESAIEKIRGNLEKYNKLF